MQRKHWKKRGIKLTKLLTIAIGAFLLFQTSFAHAQDERLARQSWAALECASLALRMGDQEEQERLFLVGYTSGLTFLSLLESRKIDKEKAIKIGPKEFMDNISGPSHEFIMGRISAIVELYISGIMKELENDFRRNRGSMIIEDGKLRMENNAEEADKKREQATEAYNEKNCDFIR